MIRRTLASAWLAALVAVDARAQGAIADIDPPESQPQVAALSIGLRTVERINPVYPEDAIANRISGWVAFRFRVSTEGRAENLNLMAASERDHFSQTSLQALLSWRFAIEPDDAAQKPRIGCALFLFQHPESPLDVAELDKEIGDRLDCGQEAVVRRIPGAVFQ